MRIFFSPSMILIFILFISACDINKKQRIKNNTYTTRVKKSSHFEYDPLSNICDFKNIVIHELSNKYEGNLEENSIF
jgi:hypothetical protein